MRNLFMYKAELYAALLSEQLTRRLCIKYNIQYMYVYILASDGKHPTQFYE